MRFQVKFVMLLAALVGVLAGCKTDKALLERGDMLDPQTCAGCHPDHYTEWLGSMHAYAGSDPIFLAMNRRGQEETDGALGDFCIKCHAPMALVEGATTDGLNMDEVPKHLQGVTCFFCHTAKEVTDDHNNPLVLADDLVMRGRYNDAIDNGVSAPFNARLHCTITFSPI